MTSGSIDITELPLPTKKLASQTVTRWSDTVHQEEVVIGDGGALSLRFSIVLFLAIDNRG